MNSKEKAMRKESQDSASLSLTPLILQILIINFCDNFQKLQLQNYYKPTHFFHGNQREKEGTGIEEDIKKGWRILVYSAMSPVCLPLRHICSQHFAVNSNAI